VLTAPDAGQLRDCVTRAIFGAIARMLAVPKKPLIACVDDDVSAREALEGFLKAFGFAPRSFRPLKSFCNLNG